MMYVPKRRRMIQQLIFVMSLLSGLTFVSTFVLVDRKTTTISTTMKNIQQSYHYERLSSRTKKLYAATEKDSSIDTPSDQQPKPTVAIVGSGAVGSYYGARLWEGGNYNVKFHMRGEHYQECQANGLNVTSIDGDIFIPPTKLMAYEDTADIGPVDWVIVALKSSSLQVIPKLIVPLLTKTTRVLVIMNGLVEDDLLSMLAKETNTDSNDNELCCGAVYGGMALICSNRLRPGRIDHSYAGLLTGGVATASSASGASNVFDPSHQEAFEMLWKDTKQSIAFEPILLRGRWMKNMWNLPFNTISVAMGGITVDKIVTDPGLRSLAYTIMDETIAIANADLAFHGHADDDNHDDDSTSIWLNEQDKEKMMAFTDIMGPYKTSTMLDLTNRRAMEVQYLFRKPLERAKALNVPAPHLETLVLQVEAMQRFHNLF